MHSLLTCCFVASNIVKYGYDMFEAAIEQAKKLSNNNVIVNVDTDSVDETVGVISKIPRITVVKYPWGIAKNRGKDWIRTQKENAIYSAKTQFIAYWDIDEVLDDEAIEPIQAIIRNKLLGYDGLQLRYRHFMCDKWHHMPDGSKGWYGVACRIAKTPTEFVHKSDGWSLAIPERRCLKLNYFVNHYGHLREGHSYVDSKKLMFSRFDLDFKPAGKPNLKLLTPFEGQHPKVIKKLYGIA